MRIAEPLIPKIAQEFSVTVGAASVIATAFALSYGLCQLVFGPLGDRFGKYRLVAIAMTVSAAVVAGAALAPSLGALALFRLAGGVAVAAIIPLGLAYVGDIVPYGERQATLARILTGQLVGVVFGQVAGGIIVELAGWRAAFLVVGGAFALVALALWIELASGRVDKARVAEPMRTGRLFRQYVRIALAPSSRRVLLAIFGEGFLFFARPISAPSAERLCPRLYADRAGARLLRAGRARLQPVRGRFVARLGEAEMMRGAAFCSARACAACRCCRPGRRLSVMLAIGLGLYMVHSTLQTNAMQMEPDARGASVCFYIRFLYKPGRRRGSARSCGRSDRVLPVSPPRDWACSPCFSGLRGARPASEAGGR
jgi:MFS family permease